MQERPAIYPYVLIAVLSVHRIIAGLALGAPVDTEDIWVIFAAIIAHKSSAAFALAVSCVRAGLEWGLSIRLLAFFTVTTPAGVLIGTAVSSFFDNRAEISFDVTISACSVASIQRVRSAISLICRL